MATSGMATVLSQDDKWNMPGWKIEQKYSPGVLIGNWAEEKLEVISIVQLHKITLEFFLNLHTSSLKKVRTSRKAPTEKRLRILLAFTSAISLPEEETCLQTR